MSVKIIIPSKDRAAQLDLLLRSIERFWSFDDLQIHIIYTYSDDIFKAGYRKHISNDHWNGLDIMYTKETDFCKDVKGAMQVPYSCDYTGFICDDCVFFRPVGVNPKVITEDVLCFQTRIGGQTYIQNYLTGETYQKIEGVHIGNLIKFNYKIRPRYSNSGYLFSMDGAIYKTDWLFDNIKNRTFESPRALEHQLNSDDSVRISAPKYMLCEEHSSLIVNTINAIQQGIPAGVHHSYTPQYLNDRWLAGYRIGLDDLVSSLGNVVSSHTEVPLIFREQNS